VSFNSKLGDYIVVAQNVIPHDLCDRVIQEYSSDAEYDPAVVGEGKLNAKVRKLRKVNISQDHVIGVNRSDRSTIDAEIFNAAGEAIKSYAAKHSEFAPSSDTGYELLKYQTGDFYTQHTDSYELYPRSISCSFALNDDYEGGHFGFFGREVTVKAPKGAAVMFPSNFMYPHEIMPVTSGTRYSIITWFI
jgi:predicted 2-oxoglutarate/Fe(II)-dependent dioxygenase YbiX